ncbi:unnamed protein product [Angiostrongylus costaricensis]|uniref:Uncharacterized protein n=1 Tax=Angiostrongylus costaricensis TaxID=334426 RepID=A0A0R3Q1N1_ANGCS|nr:unnamed protein product [Angiostrongylus costaricensis]
MTRGGCQSADHGGMEGLVDHRHGDRSHVCASVAPPTTAPQAPYSTSKSEIAKTRLVNVRCSSTTKFYSSGNH